MKRNKVFYVGLASMLIGAQLVPSVNTFASIGVVAEVENDTITVEDTEILYQENEEIEQEIEQISAEEVNLSESNVIKLRGRGIESHAYRGFDVILDKAKKQISVKNVLAGGYGMHELFGNKKYAEIELTSSNGERKALMSLTGNTRINDGIKAIDGQSFEFGDVIRIYHAERPRCVIEGEIINKSEGTKGEYLYRITENGLEEIKPSNVIKLRGRGIESHAYRGFDVKIDRTYKKLKVENVLAGGYGMHELFGNEKYVELKLISADGETKASMTLTGNTRINDGIKAIDGKSFEFGDIIKVYHREVPRCTFEGEVSNITEGLRNEYLYRITENGLEEVKLPKYTNEIELKGVISNSQIPSFKIKFDIIEKNNKKIKIEDMKYGSYGIHEGFYSNKYIEIKLYDKNGVQKHETLSLNGNSRTNEAMKLNDKSFEYGDYIKIQHQEKWRYNVEGEVENKMEVSGNEYLYRITENGLKQIQQKPKLNNVIKLRGKNIEAHPYKGFDLKIDKNDMKFKIENVYAPTYAIHNGFYNNKYIEIKLKDAQGIQKAVVTLNGTTKTGEAMKLNNVDFKYGDILEIFHDEGTAVNRYNPEGTVIDKKVSKTYKYIISEIGLIQVQ